MNYDALEKLLLSPNGAVVDYPFGPEAAVFKVAGKMFAIAAWQKEPIQVSLKCDPAEADYLRSTFEAIRPGYHLNKNHWNTVTLDDSVPDSLLRKMIASSYDLVVKGLTKAERTKLA